MCNVNWNDDVPNSDFIQIFLYIKAAVFLEHLNEPDLESSCIQFPIKSMSCHSVINFAGLKTSRLRLTSCSFVVQSQLCTGPSPNLSPCLSSQ